MAPFRVCVGYDGARCKIKRGEHSTNVTNVSVCTFVTQLSKTSEQIWMKFDVQICSYFSGQKFW